jgi:hypothetical protein
MGGSGSGRKRKQPGPEPQIKRQRLLAPLQPPPATPSTDADTKLVVAAPAFAGVVSETPTRYEPDHDGEAIKVRWQEIFSNMNSKHSKKEDVAPDGMEFLVAYYKKALGSISQCKHDSRSMTGIDMTSLSNIPQAFWILAPDPAIYWCTGIK